MTTPDDAPTPAETPKRKRSPVYDVFELREVGRRDARDSDALDSKAWFPIASAVPAGSDREAISLATDDRDEDERYGIFWAPLSINVRPRTRAAETVTKDVWS